MLHASDTVYMIPHPRNVKIAAIDWKIEWPEVIPGEDDDVKGLCDLATQTIYVQSTLPTTTQKHVLLHEILHAIWYACHVNPSINDFEEDVVSALSGPLIDVVLAHRLLRLFLFGKL